MEERRISKTRVFMTGTLTGLLWKKNYLYTVIDYNDKYSEQTIVLDFHRSAEKAQGLIYQKMIAAKKQSNGKVNCMKNGNQSVFGEFRLLKNLL